MGFAQVTLTRPGTVKAADLPRLEHAFTAAGISFHASEDYVSAIRTALASADKAGAPLLVTGSFYLLAEVKKVLDSVSNGC